MKGKYNFPIPDLAMAYSKYKDVSCLYGIIGVRNICLLSPLHLGRRWCCRSWWWDWRHGRTRGARSPVLYVGEGSVSRVVPGGDEMTVTKIITRGQSTSDIYTVNVNLLHRLNYIILSMSRRQSTDAALIRLYLDIISTPIIRCQPYRILGLKLLGIFPGDVELW